MDYSGKNNWSAYWNAQNNEKWMLGFSVLATIALLGFVLWFCRFGMEFTDEGFYLVLISNPFNYSALISPTQFGFIYHPLFKLVNENIAVFRQLTIIITFLIAWILTHQLLVTSISGQISLSSHAITKFNGKYYVLSAGFATASLSSLVLEGQWLSTPGYNMLAFQGLMIAAIGMLLAGKKLTKKHVSGWAAIGIGGWLSFMAKPTTAAGLGVVVLIYLFAAKKVRYTGVLFSIVVAVGLLILSAFLIDGSIIGFIHRVQTSYELLHLFCNQYSVANALLKFATFPIHSTRSILLYMVALAILIAAFYNQFGILKIFALSALLAIVSIVIVRVVVGGTIGSEKVQFFLKGVFHFFVITAVPFAVACLACTNRCSALRRVALHEWVIIACMFVFPLIAAFGSSGDYWYRGCSAGLFWILSALFLLVKVSDAQFRTLISFGIITPVLMGSIIVNSMVTPHRQPDWLWRNNHAVTIGTSSLILSASYGDYIKNAQIASKTAGFIKGTPIIDLTGLSPGLLFAMEANNIGQPWNLSAWENSARVAAEFLHKNSSEKIASSWVLIEPEGPLPMTTSMLLDFGADISKDYEEIASWSTPADGFRGAQIQKLLRPSRPLERAIDACEKARKQVRKELK